MSHCDCDCHDPKLDIIHFMDCCSHCYTKYLDHPFNDWSPAMKVIDITSNDGRTFMLYKKRMWGFELKDADTMEYVGFVDMYRLKEDFRLVDITGGFFPIRWELEQVEKLLKENPDRKLGIEEREFRNKFLGP